MPTTHHSEKPQSRPPAGPRAALAASPWLLALLWACGGDEAPRGDGPAADPARDGAAADEGPDRLHPKTRETLDSLLGGVDGGEDLVLPEVETPRLAFPAVSGDLPTSGTWREHPLLADFDGDGYADLVATNREEDGLNVWRGDGRGGWTLAIEGIPRNLMYGGTDAADMDEDGHLDLVFGAHQEPGLHVFFNDGDMGWTMKPKDEFDTDSLMLDVTTGDVNADGHLDVIGIGQFQGGVELHLGDGEGGLTRQRGHDALTWLRRGTQVELVDLDGDGDDDIVVVSDRGLRTIFTERGEDGALAFVDRSEGLPVPQIGNSLRGVAVADFDEDGSLDLASGCIADPSIPVDEWNWFGVYRRDENGTWVQFDTGFDRRLSLHDVLAADFDGDGHQDLFAATTSSSGLLLLGDGTGHFEPVGHLPLPGSSPRSGLGDVDGDGVPDIVLSGAPSKNAPEVSGITVHLTRRDAIEAARAAASDR